MTAVRWLLTPDEGEGRLARAELFVPPGRGELAHAHADAEERLELLAGTLAMELGGCQVALRAGDHVTVPAGVLHAWRNAGPDDVRLVMETRPSAVLAAAVEALLA